MGKKESFVSNLLKVEVKETIDYIVTNWTGKSVDRNPSKFITPILVNLLEKSNEVKKRFILDFQKLEYMNSSTITPIIKILERAKNGNGQISVIYNKLLKWQDLSFSALKIFQTKDKRVEIRGLK
ncbi:MAG: hypothetical protein JSV31_15580 [Desulfobacterales bacterium]|nr:MAG: hypothetical protein JSV31_15580 [Desulfobacterales bacterium]